MANDDIIQVISDAREDAVSLSQFMYYPATVTVNRRLAPPIHTLNYYLLYLEGLEKVYSQPTGTVEVNGEVVKTVRQSINDAIDSAILGDYQTTLEAELVQEVIRATNRENDIEDALEAEIIRATDVEGNITQDVSDLSLEVDAQKLDTGITVTSKSGTLEITQAEKNAQTISMVEYGATGEGITDDTAAFALLEANVTGREIDLQGKTYNVQHPFIENRYLNGYFKVGANVLTPLSSSHTRSSPTPLISNENVNVFSQKYSLVRGNATGGINSVPQGVAYDSNKELVYQVATGTTDGRGFSLNIFDGKTTGELTDYYINRSTLFGHQGIGVHHDNESKKSVLWMSANYNYAPNTGNLVTAFDGVVLSNTDNITDNIYTFKLFDDTTSTQSTTPTVSSCGKYLIAKLIVNDDVVVRVFDVLTMWSNRTSKTDYSTEYLWQFKIGVVANADLQSIACDGTYIYILFAEYGFTDNAQILVYTMLGNLVDDVNVSQIGLEDAINDSPNPQQQDGLKEYQGLLIFSKGGSHSLGIVLATTYNKDLAKKNCYVYEIGVANATTGLKRGRVTSGKGIIHSASQRNTSYNFGSLGSTPAEDMFWTVNTEWFGALSKQGNPIYWANGITGAVQAVSNGSEGMSNMLLARCDTGSEGARLVFHKSKSGSTDPTVIASMGSARMGRIPFSGDATTKHAQGAEILAFGTVVNDFIDSSISLKVSNATGVFTETTLSSTAFYAQVDNTVDIGTAPKGFKNIYLHAAPIISSDERLKQDFRKLKAAEKKAALEIKESICLYKMKDSVAEKGDGARWHVGVKAQQVVSIMESHGLKPFDYGFICHDTWSAQDAVLDEDGNEVQAAREAGDKYAVRYDELAMFILVAI